MSIPAALAAVRGAPTLLEALRRAGDLAAAARHDDDGARSVALLAAAAQDASDHVTAVAAVHALAGVPEQAAAEALTSFLVQGPPFRREHAAWALGARAPHPPAVPALEALAAGGHFTGMLAERTLDAWGLLPRPVPAPGDGRSGMVRAPSSTGLSGSGPGPGLTVAQVFLHADIDRDLTHAGQGDNGGIATLLVRLGDALVADGRVARVLTISRGRPAEAPGTLRDLDHPGHHFPSVPFAGPVVHAPDAWPRWAQARRGLRHVLDAAGPVDVLHLRMADVGSMVAAEVARERGIAVVFTAAPDPHALIAARDAAGTLTRATFGPVDAAEHLWFRHDLAAQLAEQAAHVVLFPRPDVERDARDLLGLDLAARPARFSVIPEGIDLSVIDRAHAEVGGEAGDAEGEGATGRALAHLDALLASLPPARRGLPLAVTVGRLHRVKGMATLVEAWASHPHLAERCNLLVVGGDLEDPSDDEQEQLARIDAVVPRPDGPARGLLLAGHRANGTVAVWLAAAGTGRRGLAAPAGAYVCASLKEEFGIAILEAMACGLVVVAPAAGGPPTYVEHGVTGVLADTADGAALARAVGAALDLAAAPDAHHRAERAHAMVRDRFGIEAMAAALAEIYRRVAAPPAPETPIARDQEGSPS